MKLTLAAATVICAALLLPAGKAEATDYRRSHAYTDRLSEHPRATYYRKRHYRPQVRGYVVRRGGYSYTYADSIDTYGDSRTRYGGTRYYRDSQLDRQTSSGPFDHGFFFDSAATPRGGDSPYMH